MICWPKERWKRKPFQIKRTLIYAFFRLLACSLCAANDLLASRLKSMQKDEYMKKKKKQTERERREKKIDGKTRFGSWFLLLTASFRLCFDFLFIFTWCFSFSHSFSIFATQIFRALLVYSTRASVSSFHSFGFVVAGLVLIIVLHLTREDNDIHAVELTV